MCGLTFEQRVEACPKASMASRYDALGFLCKGISGEVCY